MTVTERLAEDIRTQGFTWTPRLAGDDAIAEMAEIYDDVLEQRTVDFGEDYRMLGGVTRQVMYPAQHHPAVPTSGVMKAAQAACSELLGIECLFLYDMMIFKPAGHEADTPWHQDFAYFLEPFTPAGTVPVNAAIQVWVAIDDADVENGCMHFLPGVHDRPLFEHYIRSGGEDMKSRLLAIKDADAVLDLPTAVACPLSTGGATFHFEGTPHYTPPNRSADRPRRAYICNFYDPSRLTFDDR